jgi:hypothetical protein
MWPLATKNRGTKNPYRAFGMRRDEPDPVTNLQIRQLPNPLADRTLQVPIRPACTLRLQEHRTVVS